MPYVRPTSDRVCAAVRPGENLSRNVFDGAGSADRRPRARLAPAPVAGASRAAVGKKERIPLAPSVKTFATEPRGRALCTHARAARPAAFLP